MKILLGIVIGLALAAGGYYFLLPRLATHQPTASAQNPASQPCAQVVTSARNPSTGEIKVFPTPCDVPKGWDTILNDMPGL